MGDLRAGPERPAAIGSTSCSSKWRQRGYGEQQGQTARSARPEGQIELGQLGDAGEAMGPGGRATRRRRLRGRRRQSRPSFGSHAQRVPKAWRNLMQQRYGTGSQRPARAWSTHAPSRDTDPLGRPMRGHEYGEDFTVKVPGEIDAQRARRILEELRKRFGESFRPQLELDYIERLLKDF